MNALILQWYDETLFACSSLPSPPLFTGNLITLFIILVVPVALAQSLIFVLMLAIRLGLVVLNVWVWLLLVLYCKWLVL